ncbi:bifunctional folylpolyglutamate synthase/dihydrofolate synthase [Desulfonatronum thioautotrophicum]|uniref:bifunctional folylpolyglutamate synthase/dihydrofolate synthase n=1 Tax=Desulfonatronum thioautotrophicum TaxID=617001 RepID=UPI0006996E8D|nr:cyanophycin synthetase [Desulfonatronum thioautotrophicum]
MFHMHLGLGRMREAADRLNLAGMPACLAQVVGTNGKGSTAYYLAQIALEHGFSTGLFTSPHFLTLRERIRINGKIASEETILGWANTAQAACADLGLTYFETITLIAMVGFSAEHVDLIVLEAGLGGRNDATSTWHPDLLLITPIGLDHERIIGPGLENIVQDKAGAIKSGTLAISGPQTATVRDLLAQEAEGKAVAVHTSDDIPEVDWKAAGAPALPGPHQRDNARLALAGWAALAQRQGWPVRPDACALALSSKAWPGRLQRIPATPVSCPEDSPENSHEKAIGNAREFILDGAHNPSALEALKIALDNLAVCPRTVIFTCMQDKNLDHMAPLVRQLTSGPIFVPELPTHHRCRPAHEVVQALGPQAQATSDPATALARAASVAALTDGPVLICGSLYLLAEIYALQPEWLDA